MRYMQIKSGQNDKNEGILVVDTATQILIEKMVH